MRAESKQPNSQLRSSIIQANIIVIQNGLLDIALGIKEILDAPSFSLDRLKLLATQFDQHVMPKIKHEWFKPLSPIARELNSIIKEMAIHKEKYDKDKLTKEINVFINNANSLIKNFADLTKNSDYVAKLDLIRTKAQVILIHYNPKEKKAKKISETRKTKMQMLLASLEQVRSGKMSPEQLEEVVQKEITAFLGTRHGIFKSKYTPQQFETLDRSHEYAYFLRTLRDGITEFNLSLLSDISKMIESRATKVVDTKEQPKTISLKR
ncbi:MAG: hypothetical protein ACYCQI_15820 [Gammaproteobacteria bacterium]